MARKAEQQISSLLQRSHEHALIAKFATDPEARISNERMAREYLEHARLMIEEISLNMHQPGTDYTEALERAIDELSPNGCMREFPHSRH